MRQALERSRVNPRDLITLFAVAQGWPPWTWRMVLDLAHSSPAVVDDALALAKAPVFVSHTGVCGTCDGKRNPTDEHVRGVAATGGVIGIAMFEPAVGGPGVDDTAEAMRHGADLVGVEHIALGPDFDGAVRTPVDVGGLALLTDALLRHGFDEPEIAMIMGGNVRRVLRQTLPQPAGALPPDDQVLLVLFVPDPPTGRDPTPPARRWLAQRPAAPSIRPVPDRDGPAEPARPGGTPAARAGAARDPGDPAVPGWRVEHDPFGGVLLVPDPVVRAGHARTAWQLSALLLGVAVLVPLTLPAQEVETLIASAVAAAAALMVAATALRLGRSRPEWQPGDGAIVLRRRIGPRVRQVFTATALEVVTGLSDGEVVQRVVAVAAPGTRPRTVYSGWQNPGAAEQLAAWLAGHSGVPMADRRHHPR
jgi:hypothetical protein